MEFCPQLSAFQGVIISADNVNSFSSLTSKAGNDEKYKVVINSLRKFLEERRILNANGLVEAATTTVRKFAVFTILNADLLILSEMASVDEIESVIWTIPTIPKCLMCEIFWQLHFEKFVYESIAFCYPQLSLEIASAFIDNIKYYTPKDSLNKLKIINAALYRLLCRYHFFNFSNNVLTEKLTAMLNLFKRAITYFLEPPKSASLDALSTNDKYRYIGDCLYTILLLLDECIDQFSAVQQFNPINDTIYMLTYITKDINSSIGYKISDNPNQSIYDCVNECTKTLLDVCQGILMTINVDIFCAWSEFTDDNQTMQVKIGELCYKVRNKLLGAQNIAEHPFVNMVREISRKPIDLNDIVCSASIGTIIENITNSDDNKDKWLQALIKHEHVFSDASNIQCIISNLDLLNENECYELYKKVDDYISNLSDSINVEYLHLLMVKLFQHCNLDVRLDILQERFKDKCFKDMTVITEFTNMMTETFNRLFASPNSDLDPVLCLFLQSPQRVYSKIFSLAAENEQQASIMVRVMEVLDKYSNHYYNSDTEPCIIRVVVHTFGELDTEATSNNFVKFICALKSAGIITSTKLLLLVIMPIIHKALIDKDVTSLNTQCKLLKGAFTIEELLEFRAPMLAMIGQILDKLRWKINAFNPDSPAALQQAIDLQCSLFSTYGAEIPESERNWLKSKLKNMSPMNTYYYRQFWDPPGSNYVEVVTGITITPSMRSVQLITRLSQLLYSGTQQEWLKVWDSLTIFDRQRKFKLLGDSFLLIAMIERMHRTESTWSCMLYCYRTFIYIIRYKYLQEPLTDSQVSTIVDKFSVACKFSLDENKEDLALNVLPLFAYLAERRRDYKFNISQYLRTNMTNSKHEKFLDIITNVMGNSGGE